MTLIDSFMDGFKEYLENTEIDKNLKDTLKRVPKKHADLIKNFKFTWINNSILPQDDTHVGLIDPKKKTVTIAAPWRYSREYTLLHELAHLVWANLVNNDLRKEWSKIVGKNEKRDKKENDEEQFAMAYACYYCQNKIIKHNCKDWMDFIKNKVPK